MSNLLGDKIRLRRMELGISQGKLAEIMNVTQGSVSQWEKGSTYPKVESLPKLASTLGVTVDDLIGEKRAG